MTLPPCYSWSPVGQALCVPYEAPQGRRVNAVGGYISHGPAAGTFLYDIYVSLPRLKVSRSDRGQGRKPRKTPEEVAASSGLSLAEVGPIDGARLVAFLWRLAGRPALAPAGWKRERALVIVLDNYSVHKSGPVREARADLLAANVTLLYLPSYSPELSDIEPVWQSVKHHEMPERSQSEVLAMKQAVEEALARKAEGLRAKHTRTADSLCASA